MAHRIGEAAGKVWRHLDHHGPMTASKMKKELNLAPVMVDRAIGWLARERKLKQTQKGNTTYFERLL